MNRHPKLTPAPDSFDLLFGYDDETPLGEWHMHRFVRAYKEGKEAPETMQFLANAFEKVLQDLEHSKGTGEKNRDKIPNKHLPITTRKRGPSKQKATRRVVENCPSRKKAVEVELLIQRSNMKKTPAIESVSEKFDVDESVTRAAYKKHKNYAVDLVALQLGNTARAQKRKTGV